MRPAAMAVAELGFFERAAQWLRGKRHEATQGAFRPSSSSMAPSLDLGRGLGDNSSKLNF